MPLDLNGPLTTELMKREMANPSPASPQPEEEGMGALAKILFGSGLGADVATTIYGEHSGKTREANPLLKPLGGMPAALRSPLVAGAEVGGLMLLNKLIGKKHPKIMKGLTMGLGGLHAGTAVNNVLEMNKSAHPIAPSSVPSGPPSPGLVQQADGSWLNPDYFGK